MAHFRKKSWFFVKFDLWWPIVTSILTLAKNWPNTFVFISYELSNALFRFSLRCLGAELVGCFQTIPPPPACRGKSRQPVGRGLNTGHMQGRSQGGGHWNHPPLMIKGGPTHRLALPFLVGMYRGPQLLWYCSVTKLGLNAKCESANLRVPSAKLRRSVQSSCVTLSPYSANDSDQY